MGREGVVASPTKPVQAQPTAVSYGQIIEYIADKLYLASYTHPPNSSTPFPWPVKDRKSSSRKSPSRASKTSSRLSIGTAKPIVYFSIDNSLIYNAFHADFGPFNIGHLYRFAISLHEVLADNPDRAVVFWTGPDAKLRANAACILACYVVLIQNWPPHLALAPIAQMNPPCMPFRDAGYSVADFGLTIQDVVYGVWRAKEEKLCQLDNFSLEEYETFEQVHYGDFNWVTPSFIALASPQDNIQKPIPKSDPRYATIPTTPEEIQSCSQLSPAFKNVLTYFTQRNVGLIVRLNDPLYSPTYFTANNIEHMDMIFDDGTCPTLKMVRTFINKAHNMIVVKKQAIAVHCKAGLGRTGCLIGAYLIYRHGFTANEVIAYMRFMRPGMVVGPQQHWLHLNQNQFREWWFEDLMREKLAALQPATPPRNSMRNIRKASTGVSTPPHGTKRPALEQIDSNDRSPQVGAGNDDAFLPAPTPGQPRKTSKSYGRSSKRAVSAATGTENDPNFEILPDTEIVSMERHVPHEETANGDVSEDELSVHLLMRRTSRSPTARDKRRAISCAAVAGVSPNGVRKVSGRVGSLGSVREVGAVKAK